MIQRELKEEEMKKNEDKGQDERKGGLKKKQP